MIVTARSSLVTVPSASDESRVFSRLQFLSLREMTIITAGPSVLLPSTCFNDVKDGDESGLDCGGSCPKCGELGPCLSTADCASGTCTQGKCVDLLNTPITRILVDLSPVTTLNTVSNITFDLCAEPPVSLSDQPIIVFDKNQTIITSELNNISCVDESGVALLFGKNGTYDMIIVNRDINSTYTPIVCTFTTPSYATQARPVDIELMINSRQASVAYWDQDSIDTGFAAQFQHVSNSIVDGNSNYTYSSIISSTVAPDTYTIRFNPGFSSPKVTCKDLSGNPVLFTVAPDQTTISFTYFEGTSAETLTLRVQCNLLHPSTSIPAFSMPFSVTSSTGEVVFSTTQLRTAILSTVLRNQMNIRYTGIKLTDNEIIFVRQLFASTMKVDVTTVSVFKHTNPDHNAPSTYILSLYSFVNLGNAKRLFFQRDMVLFDSRLKLHFQSKMEKIYVESYNNGLNLQDNTSQGFYDNDSLFSNYDYFFQVNPPSSCFNGVLDGEETSIDCGGPDCLACKPGRTCFENSDCISNECVVKIGWLCAEEDQTKFKSIIARVEQGINTPNTPIRFVVEMAAVPDLPSPSLQIDFGDSGFRLPTDFNTACSDNGNSPNANTYSITGTVLSILDTRPASYTLHPVECGFMTSYSNNLESDINLRLVSQSTSALSVTKSHEVTNSFNSLDLTISEFSQANVPVTFTLTPQSVAILAANSIMYLYIGFEASTIDCSGPQNEILVVTQNITEDLDSRYEYYIAVPWAISYNVTSITCIIPSPDENLSRDREARAILYQADNSVFARTRSTQSLITDAEPKRTTLIHINGTRLTQNELLFMQSRLALLWSTSDVSDIVLGQQVEKLTTSDYSIRFYTRNNALVEPVSFNRKSTQLNLRQHLRTVKELRIEFVSESVSATCFDGEVNGDESDIDCGGSSLCSSCSAGKRCNSNADCLSNQCLSSLGWRCAEGDTTPFNSVYFHLEPVTFTNSAVNYTMEAYSVPSLLVGGTLRFDYTMTGITTLSNANNCVDDAFSGNNDTLSFFTSKPTNFFVKINRVISLSHQPVTCKYITPDRNWPSTTFTAYYYSVEGKKLSSFVVNTLSVVNSYTFSFTIAQQSLLQTNILFTFYPGTTNAVVNGAKIVFDLGYIPFNPVECFYLNTEYEVTRDGTTHTIHYTGEVSSVIRAISCLVTTPEVAKPSYTITAELRKPDDTHLLTYPADFPDVYNSVDLQESYSLDVKVPTSSISVNSKYAITIVYDSYPALRNTTITLNLDAVDLSYVFCDSPTFKSQDLSISVVSGKVIVVTSTRAGRIECLVKAPNSSRSALLLEVDLKGFVNDNSDTLAPSVNNTRSFKEFVRLPAVV